MTYDGSHALQPGSTLGAGRYFLKRPLGQGGMGIVWLAQDQRLEEAVALKLVPPEIRSDAGALEDLRQETLRSRRLSHPNIIRLHDLNEFPGEPPFISMEYVDGQTVAAWKAQQPQRLITWEQLRPLLRQLCDALEYAHGEKVIHRDLKPANMMLDSRGRLKLADFGLAAVVGELTSQVSQKPNTSGTPAYMSPQQMDGRTPRVTDDIYALGAMLYELLTSKPPFYHGDIPHQVRHLPVDPVEQRLSELALNNTVPPEVSALIMACLAKDPAQRPQSAAAVAEWLQLGGQSVTSALATEITQRSVGAQRTPASQAATKESVTNAPPAPPTTKEPTQPTEAKTDQSPAPPRAKWPWPKRLAVFLGVWLAIVLIGNFLKQDRPQSLFNNRDFKGWSKVGPDVWRVEAGVIKAHLTEGQRAYLVWNEPVTNFDLTFGYKPASRASGGGHHGIFYRATMPRPGSIPSGLAMPLDASQNPNKGVLLVGAAGVFTDQQPYQPQAMRVDEWNQIRIRVEGTKILQAINGVTTYEADRPDLFTASLGNLIFFEIWNGAGGGERALEIRNIVLRPIKNGTTTQPPSP